MANDYYLQSLAGGGRLQGLAVVNDYQSRIPCVAVANDYQIRQSW